MTIKAQPNVNSLPPAPLQRRIQLYPPATSIVPGASEFVDRYEVARRKREDALIEEQQRTLLYAHNEDLPPVSNPSSHRRHSTNSTVLLHTETRAVKRRSYYASHVLSRNSATIEWKTEAEAASDMMMRDYHAAQDSSSLELQTQDTSPSLLVEQLQVLPHNVVIDVQSALINDESTTKAPIRTAAVSAVVSLKRDNEEDDDDDDDDDEEEPVVTLNESLIEKSVDVHLSQRPTENAAVVIRSDSIPLPSLPLAPSVVSLPVKKLETERVVEQREKKKSTLESTNVLPPPRLSSPSLHDDSIVSVKHLSDEELSSHIHEMTEEELREVLNRTKRASEARGFSPREREREREREKEREQQETTINGMNADAVYEAMASNNLRDLNKSGVSSSNLSGALKSLKFSNS